MTPLAFVASRLDRDAPLPLVQCLSLPDKYFIGTECPTLDAYDLLPDRVRYDGREFSKYNHVRGSGVAYYLAQKEAS